MRIATLLPSATEIVCALGARGEIVGVSHECDHPPEVAGLPVLTRPRTELPRASGAVDRAVRRALEEALAVYEVDVDGLREAAPDVVVTQDLCDVCAVALDDVRAALRRIAGDHAALVSLAPSRLADVWADVRRVALAIGRKERGDALAAELGRRCDEVAARASGTADRPDVLTIEWLDPVMIGGTWMPELVSLAGGRPLVTTPGQHAPTTGRSLLERLRPDVVLVKPCGFDLARTSRELGLLRANLPWDAWTAGGTRVFVADGNAYFNRPGPRLVESLEILAGCLHPERFPELVARHAGSLLRVAPDLSLEPPDVP